ncbi:uroporphyrinogen-III C-methyltransferase [Pontibacter sp. JAM-7]|uniref:uroporphyrinogen-III C-methyltransferase n=1 Tax=Pontibacter sp. JAM-7 TaxID=3366581 RepID=UPI003AF9015D
MSEKKQPPEAQPITDTTESSHDPSPTETDVTETLQATPDDLEQAAASLEAEKSADADQTPPPPGNTAQQTASSNKPAASWPGKLALLLALLALGLGGYLFWLNMGQTQHQADTQASLRLALDTAITEARAATDQRVNQLQQQLQQIQQQSAADKRNVDELQQRLTQSIQQITAQQQTDRGDWLLAEVEYLLRLANQRVLMEQTATGALTLLKSADEILKETDDVGIYEVRKALAEDIAALEAVPRLDTEGVFLQLGALNGQVEKLPLLPVSQPHELPELLQKVTPETVAESWHSDLKAVWNKLITQFNTLIVIQHRDEPVEPLLSPQQNYYLQQNLHLMLEQAQQALLLRKAVSYRASLDKSSQWIESYFDPDSSTTQSLLRSLDELKQINVAPVMPDISGSLKSLKTYLKQMTALKQEAQAQ